MPFWTNKTDTRRRERAAVCLTGNRLELASGKRAAERFELTRLESYDSGPSPLLALQRLRRDLSASLCTTLLNAGEYQLLQVDAPAELNVEGKATLRWKIKDMVDFPVDNCTLDAFEIPLEGVAASRGRQCYTVVANNLVVTPKIHLFQDARLNLDVIDIPELAQRNVAALFEQENRGLALLNFTADGGLLTFTYKGELYVVRRIEVSLEQLEQADAARRSELFDRIALEVQRSVDNFERMYNFITLARLLTADLPTVPGLLDYLRGYLSLTVAPLDLAEVIDFPAIPELRNPRRQAECLPTIGAALRPSDA